MLKKFTSSAKSLDFDGYLISSICGGPVNDDPVKLVVDRSFFLTDSFEVFVGLTQTMTFSSPFNIYSL